MRLWRVASTRMRNIRYRWKQPSEQVDCEVKYFQWVVYIWWGNTIKKKLPFKFSNKYFRSSHFTKLHDIISLEVFFVSFLNGVRQVTWKLDIYLKNVVIWIRSSIYLKKINIIFAALFNEVSSPWQWIAISFYFLSE